MFVRVLMAVSLTLLLVGASLGIAAAQDATDPGTAFRAARSDLAAELGIPEDTVTIARAEPVAWSDSCLGLGRPDESCAQVETDGWVLWIRFAQGVFRYHADLDGTLLRVGDGPLSGELSVIELPLPDGATLRLDAPAPPTAGGGGVTGAAHDAAILPMIALVVAAAALGAGARRATRGRGQACQSD